jgi:hypothetical protein
VANLGGKNMRNVLIVVLMLITLTIKCEAATQLEYNPDYLSLQWSNMSGPNHTTILLKIINSEYYIRFDRGSAGITDLDLKHHESYRTNKTIIHRYDNELINMLNYVNVSDMPRYIKGNKLRKKWSHLSFTYKKGNVKIHKSVQIMDISTKMSYGYNEEACRMSALYCFMIRLALDAFGEKIIVKEAK